MQFNVIVETLECCPLVNGAKVSYIVVSSLPYSNCIVLSFAKFKETRAMFSVHGASKTMIKRIVREQRPAATNYSKIFFNLYSKSAKSAE